MMIKPIIIVLSFLVFFGLSACNKTEISGDYDAAEVGKIKKVVPGVLISMRPVRLHSKQAESMEFKSGNEGTGNTEPSMNRSHGFEYVIKLNSGGIISVVQAENIKLKVKQHILVIYGQHTRVVADNGSDSF